MEILHFILWHILPESIPCYIRQVHRVSLLRLCSNKNRSWFSKGDKIQVALINSCSQYPWCTFTTKLFTVNNRLEHERNLVLLHILRSKIKIINLSFFLSRWTAKEKSRYLFCLACYVSLTRMKLIPRQHNFLTTRRRDKSANFLTQFVHLFSRVFLSNIFSVNV